MLQYSVKSEHTEIIHWVLDSLRRAVSEETIVSDAKLQ